MKKLSFLSILICMITLIQCTKEDLPVSCICPTNYDPVCGSDGKTYSNACEAKCAGITQYTKCDNELVPTPADQKAIDLDGEWFFIGYQNEDKLDLSKLEKKHNFTITLAFNEKKTTDGKTIFAFGGQSAVNYYGGEYAYDANNKVTISKMRTTLMAGDEKAMDYEFKYSTRFETAIRHHFVNENTLQIFVEDPSGEAMVFSRKID